MLLTIILTFLFIFSLPLSSILGAGGDEGGFFKLGMFYTFVLFDDILFNWYMLIANYMRSLFLILAHRSREL